MANHFSFRNGDLFRLWSPFQVKLAAWMYVSRDKLRSVVFAFSMNSDHWSNLVPRLLLQGLLPDEVYEITEPIPNNMAQSTGNLRITELEVPVYQLGYNSVRLSGEILMSAGLPVKFYTLDDSVMFYLKRVRKCKKKTGSSPALTQAQPATPRTSAADISSSLAETVGELTGPRFDKLKLSKLSIGKRVYL